MLTNHISPRVLERFAYTPINSWADFAGFAATGFAAETGLSSDVLNPYVSDEQAVINLGVIEKATKGFSEEKIKAIGDYVQLHTGAFFLVTVCSNYPKVGLADATLPLTVATGAGTAMTDITAGLGQLLTGDNTYSPDVVAQAASSLKKLVPNILTEAVVGFLESFMSKPLHPEVREMFSRDVRLGIGDSAGETTFPHDANKPH